MSAPALLMDYYALTMANSYFLEGRAQEWAVFDYYFRRVPDRGGYAIFAGLEQLLDFVQNWRFSEADIAYLEKDGRFHPDFLAYLRDFRFTGEIYAFAEGSVVFPNEPIVCVRAPLIECQLLETFLLLTLNHQSLIATKAARLCRQAKGKPVFEFGARRAHGANAAIDGARAAYIGGVSATANIEASQRYGIPLVGTMAHAYVQSFDNEYEAFLAYAKSYPEHCVLLVDTYDTLGKGIPNAIRIHKEVLAPQGYALKGIRIDSGDLAYLSEKARHMLDEAGIPEAKIIVSNALDECLIRDLIQQDAQIDAFGVGENLMTARSEPVFGGVYKIVSLERDGMMQVKIKISENMSKTTVPAFKQVYRFFDKQGKAIADLLTLREEDLTDCQSYELFDPEYPWKKKIVRDFHLKPMLNVVYQNGQILGEQPSLEAIRQNTQQALKSLWREVKRLENPHGYYVDLSKALWGLRQSLIQKMRG